MATDKLFRSAQHQEKPTISAVTLKMLCSLARPRNSEIEPVLPTRAEEVAERHWAATTCGSSPVVHTFAWRLTGFLEQPSVLCESFDAFLAAPSASLLNFHQRSGAPKRVRRSSVTNRVGMSCDHAYSFKSRPIRQKPRRTFCLDDLFAVYLANILPSANARTPNCSRLTPAEDEMT